MREIECNYADVEHLEEHGSWPRGVIPGWALRVADKVHRGGAAPASPEIRHYASRQEIARLRAALKQAHDLAGWMADDDAHPNNTTPEDMTAHINGLVRRVCRDALEGQ